MSDPSPPDLLAKFGRLPDHAKTSARLTVSAAIWSGKPLDEPDLLSSLPHPHHHVLSIALTRYRCEPMIDGRILLDREWRRGDAQLMKAGVLPAGVMKSDWRLLHLYIPHRLMADALEMHPGALELTDPLGREDDCLGRLGLELEQAVMEASVTSRLLFEATTLAIMARLARRWSNAHERVDRVARRGGLAPWQVRRTQDAMASQLDADLGLDDLAAIAGCSPTHFSRAFKQSVGVPPFEWLQGLRMERAKALLAENELSLAEIALAVGFSAQPQFTTAFGKATGTTPGAWRRERRS